MDDQPGQVVVDLSTAGASSRSTLVALTRRTVEHARAGTVPLAGAIGRIAARTYVDEARWQLEMDRIFKRVPLVLGLSCELPGPHTFKAVDVAGTPVLLTRGADGEVRAFVNMCSHRGAVLMERGTCGTRRRFTCPFHAWSYDSDGALVGVADRAEFGELDLDAHGLTPLPCAERAGIVFVVIDPNGEIDIDRHLCGYGDAIEHLHLDRCRMVGRQVVTGPNWKVAYDGYLDFYHLPVLHKNTLGTGLSTRAIYDAWGPHQRVSSPDHRVLRLADVPEDEWTDRDLTHGIWTIFPHVSIAGFDVVPPEGSGVTGGVMYMVTTLYPTERPDTSITVQSFLATFEPTPELEPLIEAQQQLLLRVVRDEDYATGIRLQRALASGAKSHVLFGRNEAGGQRFHTWVDRLVAAGTDADLATAFAAADRAFQQ